MGKLSFGLERTPVEQLGRDRGIENEVPVEQPRTAIKNCFQRTVKAHSLHLLDRLVPPRNSLGDATISDVDVWLWFSETSRERLGNGKIRCLGIPSQKRHITGIVAVIWGIILIVVVAGRGGECRDLGCQTLWIWIIRIGSMSRERWGWGWGGDCGCYDRGQVGYSGSAAGG